MITKGQIDQLYVNILREHFTGFPAQAARDMQGLNAADTQRYCEVEISKILAAAETKFWSALSELKQAENDPMQKLAEAWRKGFSQD